LRAIDGAKRSASIDAGVSVLNMKKLLTSLIAALGLSTTPQAQELLPSDFEVAVIEAKKTNEFMPVWELLLNTPFFVITVPMDTGEITSDFRFSIFKSPETQNQPVVIISEVLERLENNSSSEKVIKVAGAKLIQLLNTEVGIMVALEAGAFGIPKEQVQWLRSSIQSVH